MGYDVNNTFVRIKEIDGFETQEEKIQSLQTQVVALKRDIEYAIYNLDFSNFCKRFQNRISDLEKGGS